MDWMITKLMERGSKARKRRNREITQFKTSLKDGSHVYTFWTSSADNNLTVGPLCYAKIYLTLDANVYSFMWIGTAGTTINLADYNRILDSPLAVYADTFATVCSNMQWSPMRGDYHGTLYDPPTFCDAMGYSDSVNFKNRVWTWWSAPRYGTILTYPLSFFIDLLGSTYNTNSIQQQYLDACEARAKEQAAANMTPYAETTDYRNVQGWKMEFLTGWGVLVPQLAHISPFSSLFPTTEGVAIYDYQGDGSIASTIPVVGSAAQLYHMLTVVDLEYIIHSFEGSEDRSFTEMPFRARMPLVESDADKKTWAHEIRTRAGGVPWGLGFLIGTNFYWVETWENWKKTYIRKSHTGLLDLPPKKNRPTEEKDDSPQGQSFENFKTNFNPFGSEQNIQDNVQRSGKGRWLPRWRSQ